MDVFRITISHFHAPAKSTKAVKFKKTTCQHKNVPMNILCLGYASLTIFEQSIDW